ncbi:hypothetical protein EDB92DRAFT_2065502 [Lactarius akahatsu]|uniref:Uncharacterized protein n=1 Tax=Lactarius akahatsu TaxID=416441 RepID=A0AAD4LGY3_9AGAM|nr:hypothetical protein EDB92DRAFT_2065502 [Lactarius akahatsu]
MGEFCALWRLMVRFWCQKIRILLCHRGPGQTNTSCRYLNWFFVLLLSRHHLCSDLMPILVRNALLSVITLYVVLSQTPGLVIQSGLPILLLVSGYLHLDSMSWEGWFTGFLVSTESIDEF